MNEWIIQGVSKDKLVLGFASYGQSTRLSHPALHNMGDSYPQGPGTPGRLTASATFLAYSEVCTHSSSLYFCVFAQFAVPCGIFPHEEEGEEEEKEDEEEVS